MTSAACSVDGCTKPVKARGMCQRHYHRYWTKNLNTKRCSIDGCANLVTGLGLCSKHYSRLKRNGDPLIRSSGPTPEDRFFGMVRFGEVFEGTRCLIFTGGTNSGYGAFASGGHKAVLAHRWLYERWVGPIPDGHQIHHRCHVRRCVNPTHLETTTASDHTRRHNDERGEITHCPAGHPYDEANTYIHPTRGYRCCRACHRERERQRGLDGRRPRYQRRGPVFGRECVGCGGDIPPMARLDARYCSDTCRRTATTQAMRARATP